MEECPARVKADVSGTCLHGAENLPSRANSNIAQALGKKDSLKTMINGEAGVLRKTPWQDKCRQVFLGNRATFAQAASVETAS